MVTRSSSPRCTSRNVQALPGGDTRWLRLSWTRLAVVTPGDQLVDFAVAGATSPLEGAEKRSSGENRCFLELKKNAPTRWRIGAKSSGQRPLLT